MNLGWDISTSIIGVTVIGDDGKYITSRYLDLRKSEDKTLILKCEEAEVFVRDVIEDHIHLSQGNVNHYIEDRLGNFAGGRTMLQTLMKLAAFNLAVSYMIYKQSLQVEGVKDVGLRHIHPSTVKAIMKPLGLLIPKGGDKKVLTLNYVKSREPNFPIEFNRNAKPQPWCFDMADSYIVVRAGLRKFYKPDAT